MASDNDRNHVLDVIEGPRLYVPPPNTMIVRVVDPPEATRKGVLLPDGGMSSVGGDGGKVLPLGEVVANGRPAGEKWPEFVETHGCPFRVGELVYFTVELLPMFRLHSGYWVVPWENVIVQVSRVDPEDCDVAVRDELNLPEDAALYYEPPLEKPEVLG